MDNLVSDQWLQDALSRGETAPELITLDASMHMPASGRDAKAEFAAGHIPGARFLDIASFIDPDSDVPAALPSAAGFAERMTALGVTPTSRVVLYDDSMIKTAARAWFIFRLYGHERVAILDGGLAGWKAGGGALEPGAAAPDPAEPRYAVPEQMSATVWSKGDVIGAVNNGGAQFVDARDSARFTGTSDDAVHGLDGGHIPGSRNVPFIMLYNEDGTMKDKAALAQIFADAGLRLDQPITASCGSGVTACNVLFALNQLGDSITSGETALYDGSWSEWGADPATPKETGAVAALSAE